MRSDLEEAFRSYLACQVYSNISHYTESSRRLKVRILKLAVLDSFSAVELSNKAELQGTTPVYCSVDANPGHQVRLQDSNPGGDKLVNDFRAAEHIVLTFYGILCVNSITPSQFKSLGCIEVVANIKRRFSGPRYRSQVQVLARTFSVYDVLCLSRRTLGLLDGS